MHKARWASPGYILLLLVFPALPLFLASGCSEVAEPIGDIDPDVPSKVSDLAVAVGNDTIRLTWTATGDDGHSGTAARYDLRQHGKPITPENWSEAKALADVPRPRVSGTRESYILSVGATYPAVYLCLKVFDEKGNESRLSNQVFVDLQPPGPVNDLASGRITDSFAVIEWTSPPDDGPLGHPSRYEIRISGETITEANWADSPPRNGPNRPVEAGSTESFILNDLEPLTHYFVALKALDESGNATPISNVLEFDTTAAPVGWWDGFADLETDGRVNTLFSLGDTLYVGGPFSAIGSARTLGIVAYDGADFHALGSGLSGGRWGPQAMDMVQYDGALHVSGSFTFAGGNFASNIARWTGSAWESLGSGPYDNAVLSLAEYGGDLFLGGFYYDSSSSPFTWFTRFDGSNFHSMGWIEGTGGSVASMLEFEGNLVVCGSFATVPGLDAQSIAFWDGSGYATPLPHLIGPWDHPWISAICEYQGDLIVAGDFTTDGDQALNHIARWDGHSWHPLGSGVVRGEIFGIHAMTTYKGFLVVAGMFESAGGETCHNIALWDGTYWIALGDGIQGSVAGSASINDLAVHQGSLYVGGNFLTAGGKPSLNLARWDLD